MRRRLTTVIDTLGTDAERRHHWRQIAAEHGVPCHAVVLATPPAAVRKWNKGRSKRVPDAVLRSQLAELATVADAVRGEPFDGVHEITPEVVPMLVAPSLARPSPAAASDRGDSERPLTFGLQVSQFTWPGGPPEIGPSPARHRPSRRGRRVRRPLRDGSLPTDPDVRPAMARHARELDDAGSSRRLHRHDPARHDGERDHPSQRAAARQDRGDARCAVGGRAICGLGIGWYEQEHHAYGWRFPPVAERYALLEDALELLPRMWGPGGKPFDGRLLHVPDTSCYPRPLQDRIPILVGGSGERRTLKVVAAGADACNLFGEPDVVRAQGRDAPASLRRRSGVIRQRCPCRTCRRCWWVTTPPRCGRWSTPPDRRRCRPSVTLGRSTPAPSSSTWHASTGSSMPASTTSSSASPTSPTPTPSTATASVIAAARSV